ncbi:MAG: HEAT repeat domain-containing protein, partial [Planctomycetes bacterium]|nr:HEAT repeat domain-containing protein [Planctomycetota bacterium]
LRQGDDQAAAAAASALGAAGTPEIVQALRDIVIKEGEPARARAVRALGLIPSAPARACLRELQGSADTPAALRSLIVEALREQERRGWVDGAPAPGAF